MVAIESKKQAAKRPKPPLPKAASCSISAASSMVRPNAPKPSLNSSFMPKFSAALVSMRPIKNSSER